MIPTRTLGSLLAILSLSGFVMADAQKPKPAPDAKADAAKAAKPAAAKPAAAATPLAKVGDLTITDADVQELVGGPVAKMWSDLDQQIQQAKASVTTRETEMRAAALDELVARKLVEREAKARGISVEDLTKQEVDAKVIVTPDETHTIYDAQKTQQPLAGKSEEEGLKMVDDRLRQKKSADRRSALVADLRAKGGVRMLAEPKRVAVSLDDDPVRGPKDAPITILEFSDFQCPYCSKVEVTLKQVQDHYGDKLRWVYRDYPLSFHNFAAKAAEAGACANDQGKFWEMHDKMFANQAKLGVDDLKATAASIGLDATAFNQCLDSGKNAEEWKKDLADGNKYGVTGTPAFFINGRFLNGALPYDKFVSIIDDELERKGVPPPAKTASAPAPAAPAPAPVAAAPAPAAAAPAPPPAAAPAPH
jgi:protein-disulfide isomerase